MLRQKKACSLENRPSLWQAQQENKMGHPRKENATTNTERYKTYQNKRKEEYKLNEALRKMIARQKIKQKFLRTHCIIIHLKQKFCSIIELFESLVSDFLIRSKILYCLLFRCIEH